MIDNKGTCMNLKCGKQIKRKFLVDFPDGYCEYCSKDCAKDGILGNIDQLIHEVE